MQSNTIRLHRVLRATPEKIYKAFLDPEAMAKWLPPYGFTGKVHQMDAKVGGTYKMSFTNFTTGNGHSFGGTYVELTPHERIRYTDKFDDPNLPGRMEVTVKLAAVSWSLGLISAAVTWPVSAAGSVIAPTLSCPFGIVVTT